MKKKSLEELSEKEINLEMLKIAKADNQRIKSIKNNVQFISWYLIISIFIGISVFFALN